MADDDLIPLATAAALIDDEKWKWRKEIRRALMGGDLEARGVILPGGVRSDIPPEGQCIKVPADEFADLEIDFSRSRLFPRAQSCVTLYAAVKVRRADIERRAREWTECEKGAAENAGAIAKSSFDAP